MTDITPVHYVKLRQLNEFMYQEEIANLWHPLDQREAQETRWMLDEEVIEGRLISNPDENGIAASNFRAWCSKNNIGPLSLPPVLRLWTFGEEPLPEVKAKLDGSPYWRGLQAKLAQAIEMFPEWARRQRKIAKTGNFADWLKSELGLDDREAIIASKVMSELFNELKR